MPASSASQRELLEELEAKATFVDPAEIPPDVVTMNTTFECVSGDGVEVHEWTLAYPDEADYREGRISVLSATGMGLLGARCGQTVTIRAPNDVTIQYLIRRILFQPESRHFGK
ncbi:GreA/GreB family elongation factor [Caballeronia ptereochthonis]|nr:GreA/GreB family elongation factor [Caballeronia ptereochthonis]